MSPDERRERNIYGMPGQCGKKKIAVVAWHRGQLDEKNEECYENRRTGLSYGEFRGEYLRAR
jgi:hypothetical protein